MQAVYQGSHQSRRPIASNGRRCAWEAVGANFNEVRGDEGPVLGGGLLDAGECCNQRCCITLFSLHDAD